MGCQIHIVVRDVWRLITIGGRVLRFYVLLSTVLMGACIVPRLSFLFLSKFLDFILFLS
jgi:hypothetical protein